MSKLRSRGLTVNLEKSQFNMDKVTFIGQVISGKGIRLTEECVKHLLNATEPNSASEMRSFLSLVNFSLRYMPDLAFVTEPLRKLTKKNVQFEWKSEQQKLFDETKKRMSNSETLGFFMPGCKTKLVADASNVGLGAIFVQEQHERIVSYTSQTLTHNQKW